MHTNAYKGGGGGGSDHDQNTHFVRRFIENATLTVVDRVGRSRQYSPWAH